MTGETLLALCRTRESEVRASDARFWIARCDVRTARSYEGTMLDALRVVPHMRPVDAAENARVCERAWARAVTAMLVALLGENEGEHGGR